MQEDEIAEIGWFDFDEGIDILNFDNDKRILTEAKRFIESRDL